MSRAIHIYTTEHLHQDTRQPLHIMECLRYLIISSDIEETFTLEPIALHKVVLEVLSWIMARQDMEGQLDPECITFR